MDLSTEHCTNSAPMKPTTEAPETVTAESQPISPQSDIKPEVRIKMIPDLSAKFNPSQIIKNRGGRPRRSGSDAEQVAFQRALKAKKPVTVQELNLEFANSSSRNVNANLLKRRVWEQAGKCLLCEKAFGLFVTNGTRTAKLQPTVEHFEPYSLRRNNNPSNIFAACQICNGLKRDYIFRTLNDARTWMTQRWDEAGWRDGFTFTRFRADLSLCCPN